MNRSTFGAAMIGIVLAASPALAREEQRCNPAPDATWLTVTQVAERITAQGYSNITGIEHEDRCYEVKATNKDGKRVKLHVDPVSGEIAAPARQ
jgi:hypothetical protein